MKVELRVVSVAMVRWLENSSYDDARCSGLINVGEM
jgi:hypothetical protein